MITLSFDVPYERMGLFVDLLMEEDVVVRITGQSTTQTPTKVLVKPNGSGITRHVDKKNGSTTVRIYNLLAEDTGTRDNTLENHLTSLGFNPRSASPALSRLKMCGFAEKRDGFWFRTKKLFNADELKGRHA